MNNTHADDEIKSDLMDAWNLFGIGYAVGSVLAVFIIITFPTIGVLFGPVSVALYYAVRHWIRK